MVQELQRVVLPGAVAAWKYIKAGVPQCSILGPLLFLIYINDIVEDIHSSIRLFADGSWHEHIEHVKAKSWFRLNIMHKVKFQLDRKSHEIINTSFINPFLNIPM